MATTTARNQQDVNNMSARDRLWDSLNYSYGKKREESDKSFAKAYSQAVNQGIKTGMQRSSYGAQTLANINKQQIDAQNDIYDSLIADYENRIYQLERDELEDAWKQKQFDENQRQYNENLAFQKSEANRAQSNWEQEFKETLAQNKWNREYAQDEFKYKYGLAGGGSGGSSGGGGSYTPSTNTPPASTGNPLNIDGLVDDSKKQSTGTSFWTQAKQAATNFVAQNKADKTKMAKTIGNMGNTIGNVKNNKKQMKQ